MGGCHAQAFLWPARAQNEALGHLVQYLFPCRMRRLRQSLREREGNLALLKLRQLGKDTLNRRAQVDLQHECSFRNGDGRCLVLSAQAAASSPHMAGENT
ncbi:hypothetical protein KL86APRO_12277 [uncultured Alphaproteobacteria bacterium]|uniref:Uncharacterized protein n=1 Tax=uncultured Alphaproteobacteria bacterium TaxID=91750 RepID=A0A212K7K1_9PROT|nr:hypothetical protein KL86APRO_12277 [uncultured Alphaproteobacteria bacterium]